jgi:hypothetical protein
MIWFLLGVFVGALAVWCRSCINGEQLGHTRECQLRHMDSFL